MAKLTDLPPEVLLIVFPFLPLYEEKNCKLDNGLNATNSYLSRHWNMYYWKKLFITNLEDGTGCECPHHGGGGQTQTLKLRFEHFFSLNFSTANLKYTNYLEFCLDETVGHTLTAENAKVLSPDNFTGSVKQIKLRISRHACCTRYGHDLSKVLRKQFPKAKIELHIVHKQQDDRGLPPYLERFKVMGGVDVDDCRLDLGNWYSGKEVGLAGLPVKIRNSIVISGSSGKSSFIPVEFMRPAKLFHGLRVLSLNNIRIESCRIPGSVEHFELHDCTSTGETRIQTLASTVNITLTPSRQTHSRELDAFLLEAPEVKVLTMDLIIYSDRSHKLPRLEDYELKLTSVFMELLDDEGAKDANIYYTPRSVDRWMPNIISGAWIQHDIPGGEDLFWDETSRGMDKPPPPQYRRAVVDWINYFFGTFVYRATGKLRHLSLLFPFPSEQLQTWINNTELGPLIGEIIANQKGLEFFHIHLEIADKEQVCHVFKQSPLATIIQRESDDDVVIDGLVHYCASIKMKAYTRLYNLALNEGVVVTRKFGFPAKLSGAKII